MSPDMQIFSPSNMSDQSREKKNGGISAAFFTSFTRAQRRVESTVEVGQSERHEAFEHVHRISPANRKPPQLGSPKTGLGCGPVWLCFSWGRCENSNFWGCMLYMNIDRSMEKLGVSDLGMVFDCLKVPSTILTGNTCEACAALAFETASSDS